MIVQYACPFDIAGGYHPRQMDPACQAEQESRVIFGRPVHNQCKATLRHVPGWPSDAWIGCGRPAHPPGVHVGGGYAGEVYARWID